MTRTTKEIKHIIEGFGYELLSEYMNGENRKVVILDKNGYKYDVQLVSFMNGHIPDFVGVNNPHSLENIETWLLSNRPEFMLCNGNRYSGNNKKLKFIHNISECQDIFEANWGNFYFGQGCPYCSGQRVGRYNNLAHLRPDLADEWNYEKNEIKPEEITCGSHRKVWWTCNECAYQWEARIYSRANGHKCPTCAKKLIESYIATELKDYCIKNYEAKLEYKICMNPDTTHYLPYDIYIPAGDDPEINGYYVEVHGQQHYKFNNYYHKTIEEFDYQKHKDKLKKKFAEKYGSYVEIDLRKIKTYENAIDYITNKIKEF